MWRPEILPLTGQMLLVSCLSNKGLEPEGCLIPWACPARVSGLPSAAGTSWPPGPKVTRQEAHLRQLSQRARAVQHAAAQPQPKGPGFKAWRLTYRLGSDLSRCLLCKGTVKSEPAAAPAAHGSLRPLWRTPHGSYHQERRDWLLAKSQRKELE